MPFAIEILRGIIGFMEKRIYFLVALVLIILAICNSIASQACFALAKTKHFQARNNEASQDFLEQESKQYQSRATNFLIVSLVLTFLFLISSILSVIKKEPVFHSILIVLGIAYFLLTFMHA